MHFHYETGPGILNVVEYWILFTHGIEDRQMVLRHHPDKRKAAGEEIRSDDDYFTCITKAYETLSVAAKRRAYDSVDPEFDDEVPSVNAGNKARFYEVKESLKISTWAIISFSG